MVTAFHSNGALEAVNVDTGASDDLHGFLSSFRMPLFFTASGMFASSAVKGSWGSLWKRRLETLAWLFFLWSVALWLFAKVIPLDSDPTFGDELSNLLKALIRPSEGIWFLWCLVVFYTFTKLGRLVDDRIVLPGVVALSLAGFVIKGAPAQHGVLGFVQGSLAYVNAASYLVFFWAGFRYKDLIVEKVPTTARQVLLAVVVFAFCRWGSLSAELLIARAALRFLAACVGVLLLLSLAKGCFHFVPWLAKWLSAIGGRTVPLYVLQVPIIWTIVVLLADQANGVTDGGVVAGLLHIPLALSVMGVVQLIDLSATRLGALWLFTSPRAMMHGARINPQ
jgi:fucose 4-O-acetylase-like acetyltransferase